MCAQTAVVVSPRRWIATLTLYVTRQGKFDCHGGAVLHTYLIVLLVLLGVIITTLCAVVYVSAQGKKKSCPLVTEPKSRKESDKILKVRPGTGPRLPILWGRLYPSPPVCVCTVMIHNHPEEDGVPSPGFLLPPCQGFFLAAVTTSGSPTGNRRLSLQLGFFSFVTVSVLQGDLI